MLTAFRHSLRALELGYSFGRYRLLELLMIGGPLPFGLKSLIGILQFFTPRACPKDMPAGQRLAKAFESMGPAYIKLGQSIATRPDLVGETIAWDLRALQDKLAPFPGAEARKAIETALGRPLDRLFQSFEDTPVAAASIAQVHRATSPEGVPLAVKVLRPGIEQRFSRELAFFRWGALWLERRVAKARRLRPVDVVDTLAKTVAQEMDLRLEGAGLSELRENMAGEDGYALPRLDWSRTAQRALCIEWMEGIPLSNRQAIKDSGVDTKPLAVRLVQVFLKQAMRDGFFHADMHQGNLILRPDGAIGAVDFGIMGRLKPKDRRFLAEILYGFIRRDYRHIARVHFDAGYVPKHHDVEDFAAALRAIGEPIMGLPVHEISVGNLLAQLFATTENFDMQTQPHLLLLQKTMVMVEGLALELDPNVNMWEVARPVLEDWFRENMAPEILAADWIVDHARLMRRVPHVIDHLDAALMALAEKPDPAPLRMPAPPYMGLLWLAAGGALGVALTLLFGL